MKRCRKCRYRPVHLWYLIVSNVRCRLWRGPIPRWFFDHVGGWRESLSVWLMQGLAYEYGIPNRWEREHCQCREARWIMCDAAWVEGLPKLTQDLYDEYVMDLQADRERVLAALKPAKETQHEE